MSLNPPPTNVPWVRWAGLAALLSAVLWGFCLAHNPASLALDQGLQHVQSELFKGIDPTFHPVANLLLQLLLSPVLGPLYLKSKLIAWFFATALLVFIPLGSSLFWASLGHPILKLGGAPGGWRRTWQAYALHRVVCDGLTLLVLFVVCTFPLSLFLSLGLLFTLLPLIRFGSMIFLWVRLSQVHEVGVARHLLIGVPKIILGSLCSGFISFLLAAWFALYLLVRAFAA